ncbi:hypothetical protein Tco_0535984 [Tanacetum coccineum]
MSSMGDLTFFLGLQVTQKDDGIFIKTSKPLLKDAEAEDVDVHLYTSMIGSLMYLTSSRPDIMFVIGNPQQELSIASLCEKSRTDISKQIDFMECKKQTVVANSTTKAEYVAAASCFKNPVFHSKTKHIKIRHYFIRDSNEKTLIQMIKIHTDHNVADLLTKAFDVGRFQYLIASIGMLNL